MKLHINTEYQGEEERERISNSFASHLILCDQCNPYKKENKPFHNMCDIGYKLYVKLGGMGYKFNFAPGEEK